jgi:hypothetical protein
MKQPEDNKTMDLFGIPGVPSPRTWMTGLREEDLEVIHAAMRKQVMTGTGICEVIIGPYEQGNRPIFLGVDDTVFNKIPTLEERFINAIKHVHDSDETFAEPRKKAKWKDDKSSFGRLNQSMKAKRFK